MKYKDFQIVYQEYCHDRFSNILNGKPDPSKNEWVREFTAVNYDVNEKIKHRYSRCYPYIESYETQLQDFIKYIEYWEKEYDKAENSIVAISTNYDNIIDEETSRGCIPLLFIALILIIILVIFFI